MRSRLYTQEGADGSPRTGVHCFLEMATLFLEVSSILKAWLRSSTRKLGFAIGIGLLVGRHVTADQVADFENFVEYPKGIQSLKFEMKETGVFAKPSRTFWEARWQSNAVFLRQAETLEELPTTNWFRGSWLAGRWETEYWYFGLNHPDLYVWSDDGSSSKSKSNGAYHMARSSEDIMSYVLNGGISSLRLGSIHWTNHSFEAVSDITGNTVKGVILQENGKLLGLRYAISNLKESFEWECHYSKSKLATLAFWPEIIKVYVIDRGKPLLVRELRIHALDQTKGNTISSNAFGHANYGSTLPHRIIIQGKESLYWTNRDGTLSRVSRSIPTRKRHYPAPAIFYITTGAIVTIFSVMLFKEHRKSSKVITQ